MELPPFEVDFSFLESTFHNQPDRLMLLLELMESEFSISRNNILESLAQGEVDRYRDAKHKLLPSLNYLQVVGMKDLLEDIKSHIMERPESFRLEDYEPALQHYYTTIISALQEKLLSMRQGG